MAVALALARGASARLQWALGLAVAPLVSGLLGWALLAAHVPIRSGAVAIAAASWLAWIALLNVPDPARPDAAAERPARFALWWALGLAVWVALPPLFNAYIRVRADMHNGGIVWGIVERGVPPMEPRNGGPMVAYVWLYQAYIALLTSVREGDPFVFMSCSDVLLAGAFALLVYECGLELWRDRRAAAGATVLTTLGFNAGAWLLWPMNLGRAMSGSVRGWPEIVRQFRSIHLGDTEVLHSLHAPLSFFASFLDKFLVASPLSSAWTALAVYLWASLRWLRTGDRRALAWAALAAAGSIFLHLTVGLAAMPVMLGTLALAFLLRPLAPWLPSRAALVALFAVTFAGAVVTIPYARAIAETWRGDYLGSARTMLGVNWMMIWTLVTASGVTAWFAGRGVLRARREHDGVAALIVLYGALYMAYAVFVKLPGGEEGDKFGFPTFMPVALLGGVAFLPEVRGWIARWGRWKTAAALTLVFAVPPILTLVAYLVDPGGRDHPALHRPPAEVRLDDWLAHRTPTDAVLVENRERTWPMVFARRALYIGQGDVPNAVAGLPDGEVRARRAVVADVFGGGAHVAQSAQHLRLLGRPVYVVFRPADFTPGQAPWLALERPGSGFALVHAAEGARVYRLENATAPQP